MAPKGEGLDTQLAKALSHPLRQRLLIAFAGRVASPSEIAGELNEPLGDVAYHVKRLVELGCLELVRAVPGRGGLKHFYTATVRYEIDDVSWERLGPSSRQRLAEPVAAQIVAGIEGAATNGKLAAEQVYLTFVRLRLDERAFEELSALLHTLVDEATRLERESVARQGAAGTPRSALSIAHLPYE